MAVLPFTSRPFITGAETGAWDDFPLESGVIEMGAGRPGMERGKELMTLGPGFGLCGPVPFIRIGGGTNTVRTCRGRDGLKGGRAGGLACRPRGIEWLMPRGRRGLSDIVPAITGRPRGCWCPLIII
jgi:hypothetical protein